MERYNKANGVNDAPAAPPAADRPYFTAGDPDNDIPATTPGPWWFHMIAESLRNVILAAGLVPAHNVLTLFRDAILALIAAGSSASQGVSGNFSNLKISTTGSNAQVTITADAVCLKNAAGKYLTVSNINLAINTAAVGANGLDSGVVAANTWYHTHVIYNTTTSTVAAIASLSASAPTLPSGYTYSGRFGAFRTDGTANKYPLGFTQTGRRAKYKVAAGTNVAALPIMATGSSGSPTTPTWSAIAVAAYVPPTAATILLVAYGKGDNGAGVIAAPNNAYGAYNSNTNPPPVVASTSAVNDGIGGFPAEFNLESSNIYYASGVGSANKLTCTGWTDNI